MSIVTTSITGAILGPNGVALSGALTIRVQLSKPITVDDNAVPATKYHIGTAPLSIAVATPSAAAFTLVPTGTEQGRVTPAGAVYLVTFSHSSGSWQEVWSVPDTGTAGIENLRTTDLDAAVPEFLRDVFLPKTGGEMTGNLYLKKGLALPPGEILEWEGGTGITKIYFEAGVLKIMVNGTVVATYP